MSGTEAAWMKTIRRNLARSVTSKNVSIQITQTFAKSMVLEMAPPFHTGESIEERKRIPIMANSKCASTGSSRNLRLALAEPNKNASTAPTLVILANGINPMPVIQSSGRAQ